MRVLIINSVFKYGSTGKIVEQLHNYCLTNGVDSYVCYGRGKNCYQNNVFKTSNELFSKLNQLRARITGMVYGGNFFATNKLLRIIKKIKPDIVHIHNLNDQYVSEYRLLKFLASQKIRTIITLHSEQMYTGTCGYSLDCNAWKENGCKKCPHIYISTQSKVDRTKRSFHQLKEIYSLFDKDQLVFTSCTPWLKNRAEQSILCSRFSNHTILNGADPNVYRPFSIDKITKFKKGLNLDLNKKTIVYVNPRISDPIKGYCFLDKVDKSILKNYQVIVVGKFPDDYEPISDVIYIGEVHSPELLVKLYNCADYTIMFSKKECFPMVIVESLLCGTPVSLFYCEGPDECFDNKYVKFSKYGDVISVFDNLKKFDCSREEIRNYSIAKLSSSKMCNEYITIYNKALGIDDGERIK